MAPRKDLRYLAQNKNEYYKNEYYRLHWWLSLQPTKTPAQPETSSDSP